MNVAAGVRRYEKQIPLFLLIPALTILWGALALATVVWLNRSVGRYIVKPVQALAEDSGGLRKMTTAALPFCRKGRMRLRISSEHSAG